MTIQIVQELPAPLLPLVVAPVVLQNEKCLLDCIGGRGALRFSTCEEARTSVVKALKCDTSKGFKEHEAHKVPLRWPIIVLMPGSHEKSVNVLRAQVVVVDEARLDCKLSEANE